MPAGYGHLTYDKRRDIATLRKEGLSPSALGSPTPDEILSPALAAA